MDHPSFGSPPPSSRCRDTISRGAALVLLLLSVAAAVARLHTFDEPIERDIATYAVIGHELLAGRELYSDLWDHKPPAIHVAFALAELVVGYGAWQIYVIGVTCALVTMLAVYAAARRLAGEAAGLWAAVFWVAVSCDLELQANQPNTEVFLNACLAWGFVLWLRMSGRRTAVGKAILTGCLLGVASLFKQIVAAWALSMAVGHVLAAPAARRKAALAEVALVFAAAAVWWGAVVGWFGATGRLTDFMGAVFTYNSAYAGSTLFNLLEGVKPGRLFAGTLYGALPLAIAAGLSLALLRARSLGRGAVLTMAYAVSVPIMIALPGKYYPHYYQLWLPVLALGAASALARLSGREGSAAPWRLHVAAGLVAAWLAAVQSQNFRLPAEEWSVRKYGRIFVETKAAGQLLGRVLLPGESFFEWGSEPGLYFYARRRPPTGVIYSSPMEEGPLAHRLAARTLADLDRDPPALVAVRRMRRLPPDHPVTAWFLLRYGAIELGGRDIGHRFLARTGGRFLPAPSG